MKSQPVLIEVEDKTNNKVFGCSGLMLNKKYVITTANLFLCEDSQNIFEELEPGKLYTNLFPNYNNTLNVVWNEDGLYVAKRPYIFAAFVSKNIKHSSKHIFQNWAIDSIDNNKDLSKILSVFVVLNFVKMESLESIKEIFSEWWDLSMSDNFNKGGSVYIRSVPFGNREFMDSVSQGIISNIFGTNECFVLSDCPSTPGSEGSPVYLSNSTVPIGIVLSSLSWWKGEWIGLTLIVDMKSILLELSEIPIKRFNINRVPNSGVIDDIDLSLVQIYSGGNWGSAILLNEEKGIFITNSHVIDGDTISIFHKGRNCNAKLIYKTPASSVLDLAIIRSQGNLDQFFLKAITVTKKQATVGDSIYSAGFSLFSKHCNPSPIISKGCISQINPYMLKTTCCVHPGASGGAILDNEGFLIGVIVCNIKFHENHVVYPRVSIAIPFSLVADVVLKYINSEDATVLKYLNVVSRRQLITGKGWRENYNFS